MRVQFALRHKGIQITHKILVCFSNTGGGHKSAADAIRAAINELAETESRRYGAVEVVLADIVEKSSSVHRFYVAFYNFLLRYHQNWMKYYYRVIEWLRPDDTEIGYRLAFKYAKRLLVNTDPSVVVSVHPMANFYLARMMKELRLPHKPALIVVVTDPNAQLWRGWACPDADLIIAPNELVCRSLISKGVEQKRILTMGMPVNPEFLRTPMLDKKSFLSNLGLDPNTKTIYLSAGHAGGGNASVIYEALLQAKRSMQLIVICGDNRELTEQIYKLSKAATFKTVVLDELPSMSSAMSACDLLITKAGGLTTFEAVARRLPMAIDMLTEPMPQELGTANILIEVGLAKPIQHPSDIVDIVDSLQPDERFKKAIPTKYNLDRIDSIYDIAKVVLSRCEVLNMVTTKKNC
jgi:UDP-N-acetylglucosamine:LPS N-acetylglucosamine transferase